MATIETSAGGTAIDDLYRRHVADVYRYTYAVLGNHADAEDVTQTTFVNALRALERGEEPRNAANWLLVIAHNLVRQRWRQAASRPAEVELVHDVPAAADEDEVELDSLVKALQRIPPAQREALVMRELEGRSYGEIAELLSLSTSALETLLFRARRSLAEELENVVTCESAELAISRRLDGRIGRKERRRLAAHLTDCPTCTRLAQMQTRQRRAFKGLAVLPLPIGLALFKGAPTATAAVGLPTIGSAGTATALGTATAAGGGAAAGGAAAGGTLIGAATAKVAAVVVAASVATGVGYEGVKAVRDTPTNPPAGTTRAGGTVARASSRAATPTPPTRARGTAAAPGREKQISQGAAGGSSAPASETRGNSAAAHESATPTRRRTGQATDADRGSSSSAKATGKQEATGAATARERAAARKLARDGATGGAAATGKPVKAPTAAPARGNGSPAVPAKPAKPAKPTKPTKPTTEPTKGSSAPATPNPKDQPSVKPESDAPTEAPSDGTNGQGNGPSADSGGNGQGKP